MTSISKIDKAVKLINSSFSAREENNCVLLEGNTSSYDEIILAGKTAVSKNHYGVLNNITLDGFKEEDDSPNITDYSLDNVQVDCLVIGGGVIGSAVLRELSKYKLKSVLIEKESDISTHASYKNAGVIDSGIDVYNHQYRSMYAVRGNMMFDKLASELEVPFERNGHLILLKNRFEKFFYSRVFVKSKKLLIPGVKLINRKTLLQIESEAPRWANYAIYLPSGGSIDPYKYTVALAENAVENGAIVSLNTKCLSMEVEDNLIKSVTTNRGTIYPKVVINATGVFADKIAEMANDRTFTIHPVKATNVVLDKKVSFIAKRTSFIKSPVTVIRDEYDTKRVGPIRGIRKLIKYNKKHKDNELSTIHTISGNVIIGPKKEETPIRYDYSPDIKIINNILDEQRKVSPKIKKSDVISYYSGTRAQTFEEDFVIRKGIATKNIIEAAGIEYPGLTASPAIALDVADFTIDYLKECGIDVKVNKVFNPHHTSVKPIKDYPSTLRDKLIKSNPKYGIIVCKCEEISLGEIEDCMKSPIPVYNLDAIKRRIGASGGRCQGSFCLPLIQEAIARKKRTDIINIKKSSNDSIILYQKVEGIKHE